jgi:hypothetical protein
MHGLTCPLTMTGCASSHCLPRDAPEDNGGELEQFGELLVPLALGLPPVVRLALQGNHSVSPTSGRRATFRQLADSVVAMRVSCQFEPSCGTHL